MSRPQPTPSPAPQTTKAVKAAKATPSKAAAAPRPAKRPAAPQAPAKAATTAKAAAAPATAPVPAAAPAKAKAANAAKPDKPSKPREKLVRDSFTMPKADFDRIAALKARALQARRPAKKSELLRAGLQVLEGLAVAELVMVLERLVPLKPGRPKKAR